MPSGAPRRRPWCADRRGGRRRHPPARDARAARCSAPPRSARSTTSALTRATARALGADLRGAGIDLDLGPVADVNSNPDNPVIGTRSFGADPDHVAQPRRRLGRAACRRPGVGGLRQALPRPRRDRGQTATSSCPTLDVDGDVLARPRPAAVRGRGRRRRGAVMTSHILVPRARPGPARDPERGRCWPAAARAGLRRRHRHRRPRHGRRQRRTRHPGRRGARAGRRRRPALPRPGQGRGAGRAVQRGDRRRRASGRLPEQRLAEAARRVASDAARVAGAARCRSTRTPSSAGARSALRGRGRAARPLRRASSSASTTPANIAVGEVPWGLPAEPAGDAAAVLRVRPGGPWSSRPVTLTGTPPRWR